MCPLDTGEPGSAAAIDAVALALAAATQPARAAGLLRREAQLWPALPLAPSLTVLQVHGPGAEAHWRAEARRTLQRAAGHGHAPVWPSHPDYPAGLSEIDDPPLLLWCHGDRTCLAAPLVALVGSRHATPAGREIAFHLAADLAAAGVVVVSGFARGVDAAAHRGALSRGRTVAVLGCGLDVPYPSDHDDLRAQVPAAGLLVSEFPPGLGPRPHHFPLRNRAISGLCAGVVVVQAARRSGSLITARMALEQGREVMAVPGDVRSGAHAGAHALIRDGARLVEGADDVLDELGWRPAAAPGDADGAVATPLPSAPLAALLACGEGMTLDDLLGQTGRSSADLLGELLDLELAGQVRRDGAGRFLPVQRKW